MLDFRILGPLEVADGALPLVLGGPRQRATLAILLLNANSVVSIDRLADDLYAGAAPVTAVTQVQRQISELRKALGAGATIETRPPGYLIRLAPEQLDLWRFELATQEAGRARERGDRAAAADLFREALDLWRGAPLADFAYQPFAGNAIARLEELRLAALEERIEAELGLGRHGELLAELEALTWEQPLRERLRGQLMLALYRAGRQAEALEVYRRTRETLVERLGIEPTRALRDLERAILAQDPTLELGGSAESATRHRTLLVVVSGDGHLDALLSAAAPLARAQDTELIVAQLLTGEGGLSAAAEILAERAGAIGSSCRSAVFTTAEPARDTIRLARTYDVELILQAAPELESETLPADLVALLEHAPSDVGLLLRGPIDWDAGEGVAVPFGGGEHDWTALELAAWLASASGKPLRAIGTNADPTRGQRDASRLLADASLALQRVAGVSATPVMAEPTEEALVAAVAGATVVVVGLSPRWRREGLGAARHALATRSASPLLLARRGMRPGGLAPRDSRTRFSWSLGS